MDTRKQSLILVIIIIGLMLLFWFFGYGNGWHSGWKARHELYMKETFKQLNI